MDVMPAGDSSKWECNPFDAVERNGRIIGRGAADCKGGLAAQIYAAALLKRSLLPMNGSVVVAATVTEKNGISAGTRMLITKTLPELGIKPAVAVLGEPTGLGIYYGHDGWIEIDVGLTGTDTFGVKDAVDVVADEIKSDLGDSGFSDFQINEPGYGEFAGSGIATIRLRRRLGEQENPDAVVAGIRRRAVAAASGVAEVAVTASVRIEDQMFYTGNFISNQYVAKAWSMDPFHPVLTRAMHSLDAAGCEVRPGKWKLTDIGKGTSGSVLSGEARIPTFGYGPGQEEIAHEINEYVDTDFLEKAVYGTAVIAHGIAGVPVCGWTMDEI
jgi:acetylornithine deacetylase/succinyl-diaminopimelate desuccinylase-like protein